MAMSLKKKNALLLVCTFLKLGFTPCKAEQSLRGIELQKKKKKKDTKSLKHIGNLFRNNLKGVC